MKAVICHAYGPPEGLVMEDVAPRPLAPDEIRVEVHAAAVNINESLKLQGRHHEKPAVPYTPGGDLAGVVMELGADVTRFAIGDRIVGGAKTTIGAWAEQAVALEELSVRIPDAMSFDVAAGFLSGYATAYDAVIHTARIAAGETVLVTGAAGGVGLAAIEICKILGATVIAVAGGDAKIALCRSRGADALIDHARQSLREEVARITAGKGVDAVIEVCGGDMLRESLRCLAWRGRLVVTGSTSFDNPDMKGLYLLLKGIEMRGANLSLTIRHDLPAYHAACRQLFAWLEAGQLRPHVSASFRFSDYVEAIRFVLRRTHTGKVVIRIRD